MVLVLYELEVESRFWVCIKRYSNIWLERPWGVRVGRPSQFTLMAELGTEGTNGLGSFG
jgi:hypothetical protein